METWGEQGCAPTGGRVLSGATRPLEKGAKGADVKG